MLSMTLDLMEHWLWRTTRVGRLCCRSRNISREGQGVYVRQYITMHSNAIVKTIIRLLEGRRSQRDPKIFILGGGCLHEAVYRRCGSTALGLTSMRICKLRYGISVERTFHDRSWTSQFENLPALASVLGLA